MSHFLTYFVLIQTPISWVRDRFLCSFMVNRHFISATSVITTHLFDVELSTMQSTTIDPICPTHDTFNHFLPSRLDFQLAQKRVVRYPSEQTEYIYLINLVVKLRLSKEADT